MLVIYDTKGQVLETLESRNPAILEETKRIAESRGDFWLETDLSRVSTYEFYIKNGVLTPVGESPGKGYTFDYSTQQWIGDLEKQKTIVKTIRDGLLAESDWTDTVSAKGRLGNFQEWQDYRQKLRDISKQAGYPFEVVYPEKPI